MSCFIWRCIYVIKSLANQAEGWYSFHRQWGDSCLIVWCGNLTILLSGLTFHCFWYRKQKTLCDSLHRPSRSDFVQFVFSVLVKYPPGDRYCYRTRFRSGRNAAVHRSAKDALQVPALLYGAYTIPVSRLLSFPSRKQI